jgi:two-component system, LuxR family, sensor kinase FixL
MKLDDFEQKFLQLANNIDAVFWLKNSTNTELLYVSPKYEDIWGRSCQELYADPLSFFNNLHKDDKDYVKSHFENDQLKKKRFDAEYRIIKPNGEIRWIKDRGFPVTNINGEIYRCAGIALNITYQKNMEEKIKTNQKALEALVGQRTKELENSNSMLKEFVDISSHDLQEPLRKIIMFGDRLKTRIIPDDKESICFLEKIEKAAFRMKNLIEDLLKYTQIESSNKTHDFIDLNEVVSQVKEDLEVRIAETKGKICFDKLPTLQADPFHLHQLFLNLIGNALKFHRKGVSPVVELSSLKIENGFWKIAINDNGIGIDEKHIEQIFKPFKRLHGKNAFEGTGIGLTICNNIVARYSGEIAVKRNSKDGSTFELTLPEKQSNQVAN